ncbi:hypothetical protein KUV47_11285 [Vannielia litorea]|uniref:thioesterase domain-containing protein n=1 Tax=Vannielia litorea TaxID=1217970 RepID=UPI001C953AB7|nr:thioesterase domain-containing protein [Vannielia litorea]MBY6153798.1 hypothetical protein [Vannielia litorea]
MNVAQTMNAPSAHDTNPLKAQVLEAFGAVFKEATVTGADDFFDLGGDSLLAEELAMRLTEIAGHEVRISALFDHPTPDAMASFLAPGEKASAAPASMRPPIFMVHGASGYTMPKPSFFEGLAEGQKLELFQLPGLMGDRRIPDNIPEIAAIYVDQIERDHPEGRVHISAFCDGAIIAVEMARQLNQRGRKVDHMVLLDPGVPKILRRAHEGIPARFRSRVGFALVTGRFTGGQGIEDINDPRLRKLRGKLAGFEAYIRSLRARLTGHRADRYYRGRRLFAESRLISAWSHFWPTPFLEEVDLICTKDRQSFHEAENSFWRMVLPNFRIWPMLEKHEDVTGGASINVSEKLQALFDESEGR